MFRIPTVAFFHSLALRVELVTVGWNFTYPGHKDTTKQNYSSNCEIMIWSDNRKYRNTESCRLLT